MSRYLPGEVFELEGAQTPPARARPAFGIDLRAWLFLGMGLAGILTVALVVTADSVYADIDAMRGVSASGLRPVDPPITGIPFLGGLLSKIHDLAPGFLVPSPDSVGGIVPGTPSPTPSAPAAGRATGPSAVPSKAPGAARSPVPSAAPTPPPISSSAPKATPAELPTGTPPPAATPAPTRGPSASPAPPGPAIAISIDRGATAVFDLAQLIPGDSIARSVTVQNGGSVAFRYAVSVTQTASTPLWSDPVDGLQLTVRTAGGAVLYAGPLSALGSLAGPTALAPGMTELLSYTVDFPPTASNAFQGLTQDLVLVFDAIELP